MRITIPSVILFLSSLVAAQSSPELSTELRALSAGWKANVVRIHSLTLSGKLHIMDKSLLDYPDLDGRRFDSQTAVFSVWADKSRFRSDVSWDRTVNLTDRRLQYNLPLAEHFVPANEQVDEKAVLRAHGTTQSTYQWIYVNDFQATLTREARRLDVSPPGAPPGYTCPFRSILHQAVVGSQTLPEYLQAKVSNEKTVRTTVRRQEDGTCAIDFYWCQGSDSRDAPSGHTTLALDPDRGFCVTRYASTVSGKPEIDFQFEYTAIDGIWVMTKEVRKYYRGGGSEPSEVSTLTIDANSLKLNSAIEPEVFTLEALKIPKGTFIYDRIKNAEYLYNDIPLHLKVAVSQAQRELEKLPDSLFHERPPTGVPSLEKQDLPRAGTQPVSPGVVAVKTGTGDGRAWVYAVPIAAAGVAMILALAVLLAKRRRAK